MGITEHIGHIQSILRSQKHSPVHFFDCEALVLQQCQYLVQVDLRNAGAVLLEAFEVSLPASLIMSKAFKICVNLFLHIISLKPADGFFCYSKIPGRQVENTRPRPMLSD